jgi:hypothetical protein
LDYSFREKGFQEMVLESINERKASGCLAQGGAHDFLHHHLIPAKPAGPAGSQFSSKSIREEIMNTKYLSHAGIASLPVVGFAPLAFAQSEQIRKKPSIE